MFTIGKKLQYVLGGTYIGVAPILETLNFMVVFSTLGMRMSACTKTLSLISENEKQLKCS